MPDISGIFCTGDVSTRENVNKRITAAKAGFQALYGIWGKKGIDDDLTRELFCSMVQGALLSGMEAEVPSERDLCKMGRTQCMLARRALGAKGSYENSRGRRQLSNEQVRKITRLCTVDSTLRARRLKWWMNIMANPGENKQLMAALFGTMEREVREGKVLGPTPWVLQLAHDLEEYSVLTQQWGIVRGALIQQVKDMGGTVLLRSVWRERYKWLNPEADKIHTLSRVSPPQ